MGDLKIKDLGIYQVGGTLASGEARAYGDSGIGTELTLKGAEVSMNVEAMVVDDSPLLKKKSNLDTGYYQFGESDQAGIQMPTWTLRGYVNRDNESDMIVLGRLRFMCQTKGIKELYSASDTNWFDIIAYCQYGENEYNSVTGKVTKIYVRIKSMSVSQSADKKGFNYTLNLVETN